MPSQTGENIIQTAPWTPAPWDGGITAFAYMESLSMRHKLVEQMLTIRLVEDRLQDLCNQGLAGDLHFSKGQEAISVGVMAALRQTDYVVTHHRTIAHAIARGVPLRPLLAEILGKAEGINGGMAGEMHLSYPKMRFLFSFQLVGTCVPVAAGVAWAIKNHLKTDDIVTVFFGDAATANGQFHEGLNIAAVQSLPLLLVCENNRLAGNVRPEHYMPTESVVERASGYYIRGEVVDGNNVEAVLAAAMRAAAYVRRESKPFLLECETTRLGKHKQGQGDLRTKEEIAELAKRDPLKPEDLQSANRTLVEAMVNNMIREALAGPDPMAPKESV